MTRPVYEFLRQFLRGNDRLCVVKAPPGSGKSYNLLEALESAVDDEYRVAIAAQTNNQVDDLCQRFVDRFPGHGVIRFSSASYEPPADLHPEIHVVQQTPHLPDGPSVVIGTVAKFGLVDIKNLHDLLFIDEAWQMTWADFLTLRDVANRYVMIGDPGQIPPTIRVPVDRWEVAPSAPHRAAPEVVLSTPGLSAITTILNLDTCFRLPADSVAVVRSFYDFEFGAAAQPGERFVRPVKSPNLAVSVDRTIAALESHSTIILTLPSRDEEIVNSPDTELAECVASVAKRLLQLDCVFAANAADSTSPRTLEPQHIGIVSTHNLMNTAIERALPKRLRGPGGIRVTTPERWQGLERPVMIAVHPLSGVTMPSAFDLETGRLCVMASRHQSACIFVSRDHVGETLDSHLPVADQALGCADIVGRGHTQHTEFWTYHLERGLIV